jgi:hypothetical protein
VYAIPTKTGSFSPGGTAWKGEKNDAETKCSPSPACELGRDFGGPPQWERLRAPRRSRDRGRPDVARRSFFTRDNILALFEDRVRDLREPDGAIVAVIRLRQYAQQSSAAVGLIVEMARVIAVADGRMDPREQSILELIGSGFEAELSSLAPRYRPEGAAR